MKRKFENRQQVLWAGKKVIVLHARYDYPTSAFRWNAATGQHEPKPGCDKEWLYGVGGTNREIREKYLSEIV